MSLSAGQHKATVTIDARVDSADRNIRKLSRRVDKYERALAKAERAQKKTGSTLDPMEAKVTSAAGKVDKLSKVLGAAGLVSAAIGAVQQLDELVQKTQYQNVMRNLPFSVEKAKTATLGLVDSYELAKAAIQAKRLGVVKTEEDFARLAEAGAKLALTVGEDANKGVADLTLALGSAAILDNLDNLGITLKAAEAQSEYAKRLGVSVDTLTDAQRASAFREVGLERAMLAAVKTNVTIDEGAAKWNATKQELAELGRETLPRLLDALGLVVDYYENLIEVAGRYVGAIDTVIDEVIRFLELGAIYDEHVTSVRGLAGAYEELGLAAEMARRAQEARQAAGQRHRRRCHRELHPQEGRRRGAQRGDWGFTCATIERPFRATAGCSHRSGSQARRGRQRS